MENLLSVDAVSHIYWSGRSGMQHHSEIVRDLPTRTIGAGRRGVATYLKVQWHHQDPRETLEAEWLYHEVGDDGFETRRVEVFSGGRMARADAIDEEAKTSLAGSPLMPLEEINAQAGFHAELIDRGSFEAIWARAGLPAK